MEPTLKFAISYAVTLAINGLAFGGKDFWTIVVTYGIFGLPFLIGVAFVASVLERSGLDQWAGLIAAIVVFALLSALGGGSGSDFMEVLLPLLLFGVTWSLLSWRFASV